jgi:hypothetical protein
MSGSFVGDNLRVLRPVPRGHSLRLADRLTCRGFEPMTTRRILRHGRQMSAANHNFYQPRRPAAGGDQVMERQCLDLEGVRPSGWLGRGWQWVARRLRIQR